MSGGRRGGEKRGAGGSGDTTEEMTTLTPEACRILFSASLSNAEPKTGKWCDHSHMLLANLPTK